MVEDSLAASDLVHGVFRLGADGVLVVGELNPFGGDPTFALHDEPEGCSGHRLRRIMGLDSDRYLALGRVNLCEGTWRMALARDSAGMIFRRIPMGKGGQPILVILLGAKVSEAFSRITLVGDVPSTRRRQALVAWQVGFDAFTSATFVCLPHPSGLNRVWSAGGNFMLRGGPVDRARLLLRSLASHVPWGEAGPAIKDTPP